MPLIEVRWARLSLISGKSMHFELSAADRDDIARFNYDGACHCVFVLECPVAAPRVGKPADIVFEVNLCMLTRYVNVILQANLVFFIAPNDKSVTVKLVSLPRFNLYKAAHTFEFGFLKLARFFRHLD